MMTKRIFYLLILFVLLFQFAKSATWIATSAGYWSSSNTWSTGIVPPTTSSDTFLIQSPVALTNDLWFNSGAYIQIDSAGGLCGHYTLHLDSGTNLLKYGILELDILSIAWGHATLLAPGQVVLTQYGVLTGSGATLVVNGPAMSVGPWFNCVQPEYSFIAGVEEINANKINLFPNPCDGHFILSSPISFSKALFLMRDIAGRVVFEQDIFSLNNTESIDASRMESGIYYWEVNADNAVFMRGKIEILK